MTTEPTDIYRGKRVKPSFFAKIIKTDGVDYKNSDYFGFLFRFDQDIATIKEIFENQGIYTIKAKFQKHRKIH